MAEILRERKIMDVLKEISFDREIAMLKDNNKLAKARDNEFNRLKNRHINWVMGP